MIKKRTLIIMVCIVVLYSGSGFAGLDITTEGNYFKDSQGRTIMFRGVNVGGSNKVPYQPDGATYIQKNFFQHRDVSFVGRPFPLEKADEHFSRLKQWGLKLIRLPVTWEAIEHDGPGQYDEEYLDYLYKLVKKANEHNLLVFIDPHQDVWSRWTGGDGAPGWTLEKLGIKLENLPKTEAALTHQSKGKPIPRMWLTNYTKYGAATMFTLFFGGNDFAPQTKIDGVPVQDYLQNHFINSMKQVASRLKSLPNVIGFETLNEPGSGYIGARTLDGPLVFMRKGKTPTSLEGMLLAAGYSQQVGVYKNGRKKEEVKLNQAGVSLWKDGYEPIWKKNKVWTDKDSNPKGLDVNHFCIVDGKRVNFNKDYYKPFLEKYIAGIRSVMPDSIIFIQSAITKSKPPKFKKDEIKNLAHTPHVYDAKTLKRGEFYPHVPQESDDILIQRFASKLAQIPKKTDMPTLIGEFGLRFDLNNGRAYKNGDFSAHVRALNCYYKAIEENLLSCAIWNYTADNTNKHGDQWNGEDFSIFSYDQQKNYDNLNSGGRGLKGFIRPYPHKIAGKPVSMNFNLEQRIFKFEFKNNPQIKAPTEFFIPRYQYPKGYNVSLSAGDYEINYDQQQLRIKDCSVNDVVTLKVTPKD